MSYVVAGTDAIAAAASDVADIGSTISSANATAAIPTTGVVASAADEVSRQVAALFSSHAEGYQQLSAQMSAFHDQFALALQAGANSYASTEASAAQTLANVLNAPAEKLLGQPLIGNGSALSGAASQIQSIFSGTGGSSALGGSAVATQIASALRLPATAGTSGLSASSAILQPAANAAAASGSIGNAIENFYNFVEPYVAYGFNLASYLVGWLPYIGILAPQINFFYYLFEPMVQSVLFNTIDFLGGTVTFSQGLSNIWSATTASVNQFIQTEIYWVRSFFPPLPPLP
jgi:hypothetical protein